MMNILKTNYAPGFMLSIFVVVLIALLSNPSNSQADQNDPRLDKLFHQLKIAERSNQTLETLIWSIWTQNDDPDLSTTMQNGINAMSVHGFSKALKSFTNLIEKAPEFAEGWNKRATLYYLMGQFDSSMRDVQKVLVLEPRHFGALSGMGLIFLQSGNDIRALQAFQAAAAINPHMKNVNEFIKMLEEKIASSAI